MTLSKFHFRALVSFLLTITPCFGQGNDILRISRSGTTIISLNSGGVLICPRAGYRNDANSTSPPGLRLSRSGGYAAWLDSGSLGMRLSVAGRLSPESWNSEMGLNVFCPSGQMVANMTATDFKTAGRAVCDSSDPSQSGPFSFFTVFYGAGGDQTIPEYAAPIQSWVTKRIDISPFFNAVDPSLWIFSSMNVPINGKLWYPASGGPWPLVAIMHGNYVPYGRSELGYGYLAELLASYGIAVISCDCNFLNGNTSGETSARALILLEHIKQLLFWNRVPGHPLFGKIDTTAIMIVGHSRGGEAAAAASCINHYSSLKPDPSSLPIPLDQTAGLGPYGFSIRLVAAIAPVDGLYYLPDSGLPVVCDNYWAIHGGKDNSVQPFLGQRVFERAMPFDPGNAGTSAPGVKAYAFIDQFCHNYFNSQWDLDQGSPNTVSRSTHERVARAYIGSLARAFLLGQSNMLSAVASPYGPLPTPIPGLAYRVRFQDRLRVLIDHHEEDSSMFTPSPPFAGNKFYSGFSFAGDYYLDVGPWEELSIPTHGLALQWPAPGALVYLRLNSSLSAVPYQALAVQMCQVADTTLFNDTARELTVRLYDYSGRWADVSTSSIAPLPYPQPNMLRTRQSIMQTFRFPLKLFTEKGIDCARISGISFCFNRSPRGYVLMDDLQFTY